MGKLLEYPSEFVPVELSVVPSPESLRSLAFVQAVCLFALLTPADSALPAGSLHQFVPVFAPDRFVPWILPLPVYLELMSASVQTLHRPRYYR